jgi:hypothetical protein
MSEQSTISNLHVFIISWQGQHENAILIAEKISQLNIKLSIVYSDPNPDFVPDVQCQLKRTSNQLFWADKFSACLDAADDEGLLVIHADCTCQDWAALVKRCNDISQNAKEIGVWAPKIDGTYWNLSVSGIVKLKNSNLVISALTDGIVFYLSPAIITRMRKVNYVNNIFGWGIDSLFCSTAHVNNKLVVIDTSVNVFHPVKKTGYDTKSATIQMNEFLNQFTNREKIQFQLLKNHVQFNYLKLNSGIKNYHLNPSDPML